MPFSTEVNLGPGDVVLDAVAAPDLPSLPHLAGCISIPVGTEVGLGPSDIVLDENPAAP